MGDVIASSARAYDSSIRPQCYNGTLITREAVGVLSDSKIKALISDGILVNADENNTGSVSYDLRTDAFYTAEGKASSAELAPGDSVFVAAKERIKLPQTLTARVLLRNSRIRQGLTLDAPVYFPGHSTVVYFRVTNMSANAISLDTSKGLAQLAFDSVDGEVEHPYVGSFSNEFDYRGLADYSDIYRADIHEVNSKVKEIQGIERHIYGNVLALMAIFAAIFSLVNINIGAFANGLDGSMIVVVNLATIGSFAFLCALIAFVVKPNEKKLWVVPAVMAVAAFAAAVVIALGAH